jgi:hypothetical protein
MPLGTRVVDVDERHVVTQNVVWPAYR